MTKTPNLCLCGAEQTEDLSQCIVCRVYKCEDCFPWGDSEPCVRCGDFDDDESEYGL